MSRQSRLPRRRNRSQYGLTMAARCGRNPMEPGDLRAAITYADKVSNGSEETFFLVCDWAREHLPARRRIETIWRIILAQEFVSHNLEMLCDLDLVRQSESEALWAQEALIDALATCRFTKRGKDGFFEIALSDITRALAKLEGEDDG